MKKITPHLYQLNLGFVNAFLIEDTLPGSGPAANPTPGLTLVDTGTPGNLVERGLPSDAPLQVSPGLLNQLIYQLFIRRGGSIDPVHITRGLTDGEIIPIGGPGGVKVIYTPGHSAGHLSLLLQADRVLITADICANAAGLDWSTVYEDRELGRQSILKAAKNDFDKAVFGHGRPLTNAANTRLNSTFAPDSGS